MSDEEKFPEYEDEVPPPSDEKAPTFEETYGEFQHDSTIEPQVIGDEEERKRKRRRRILIIVFGVTLPILLVAGIVIFVVLSIIGAFESCAVNCCDSCSQNCADSCSDSCSDSCTCNCSNSIGKITTLEVLENAKNQLLWFINLIFRI